MRRQTEGHAQIPNPKELNQDVPIEVSFLIEKLMLRDPDLRPRDWSDVCRDIDRVSAGELPEPELAQPGTSIVAYEVKARPKPPPTVITEEPVSSHAPPAQSSVFLPAPAWHAGLPEFFKRPAVLGAVAAAVVILALVFTLSATRSPNKPVPIPAPRPATKRPLRVPSLLPPAQNRFRFRMWTRS